MLRSIKEIKGAHIHARDGRIGGVEALYFDDESWEVRYFVVGAGNLFANQKVLLAPHLVREENNADGSFAQRSHLTREQIKNAPGIETAPPVSGQREAAYLEAAYLEAAPYWMASGEVAAPMWAPTDARTFSATNRATSGARDPRLRSTREVRGYRVRSLDGEIGHVEDFIIDAEGGAIRYVAVDTRNWLPGKKALVASPWV
jgi:sporulation protein YlmC with PRC-barrel domain